jgi:hypothetical protein
MLATFPNQEQGHPTSQFQVTFRDRKVRNTETNRPTTHEAPLLEVVPQSDN